MTSPRGASALGVQRSAGGQLYFVRTDHIGRPVFATDSAATKVWEADYLPFGGVRVTTDAPIALRFPGQWYQADPASLGAPPVRG